MQTLSKEVEDSKCARDNLDNVSTSENCPDDINNISLDEKNSEEIEKFCENIFNLSGALNEENTFDKEYILKMIKNLSSESEENINDSVESLSSLLSFDKCTTRDNCLCTERQACNASCLCKHENNCIPNECRLSSKMKCTPSEVNDSDYVITSEESEESNKVKLEKSQTKKRSINYDSESSLSKTLDTLEHLKPYLYQELQNTLKMNNTFDDINKIKFQNFDPKSINLKELTGRFCSEYEKLGHFSNENSAVVENNCNNISQNGKKISEDLLNQKYNNIYESLSEDYVENKAPNQYSAYIKSGSSRSSRNKKDFHKLDRQTSLEKLVEYINQPSVSAY